ncbi:Hypothetical protein BHY_0671 [Borrelia nietonii YOR]|uniref:Lipoprotein n=1 Tax=Borrelia nietonii YOR TaxID=1293576 RepID=A0ABM5PHM0_9SPIR|nr:MULTISPECIES: hypothetical protein [Borrelia]AHH03622.1 Hypothetical protein BHY_0671 [Borrelia nietonii YOR]AHH14125.1 Hypothetical protein BHW_0052500 [Borrelia hermsii MTW]UPA09319.1 hypothetical protein bhYOR_000633 [Borrelia nietonii YOR]
MDKFYKFMLVPLIFIACTTVSEINLQDDASGTVSLILNVNKEFERIRKELVATLVGAEIAKMPLFPIDKIEKYFSDEGKKLGLKLLSIKSNGDSLKLVAQFDNLVKVLKDYLKEETMPIFKVENKNGKNILDMDINLKNVTKVINENKEDVSDALAALLPSEEIPMSEKEYKDALVYFLSDFTSHASDLIDNSDITVKIKTSRTIQEQFGFKQLNLNSLELKLGMIRALSLERPIKLRLVY